jgi:release factor glutamine methyltransferase
MTTVGAALAIGARSLRDGGIEHSRREARLLMAFVRGQAPEKVFAEPDAELQPAAEALFLSLIRRRTDGEPLSHIVGRREFWGLDFAVGPDVLDPRADTETVVALALEQVADRAAPLRVLDLGTGSGCILLALLHELPSATGLGVDRSTAALNVAVGNAHALGLTDRARFIESDWAAAVEGRFDLVVSNPPYIPSADIAGLAPEVARHEPRLALDGGPDGLEAYRRIAAALPSLLAAGGIATVELGAGQADDVAAIFAAAGAPEVARRRDLGGHVRALAICLAGANRY